MQRQVPCDLIKMEKLVRELTDLHNRGKEVILVSSGAIAVGRKTIGMKERTLTACQYQAGMCIHRTSKTDDDVSEIFHGIQPDRITGSDDQEYAGEWREQDQCPEYLRYIAPVWEPFLL